MSTPCFNHPETQSAGSCINCGMTYCTDCIRQVGRVLACTKCAPAIHARLEQNGQIPPTQPNPSSYPPQQTYGTQPPYAGTPPAQQAWPPPPQQPIPGATQSYGGRVYANPHTTADFIKGLCLASAIGIAGSILILKLLFYAHFGLSYLYILVGYGIGWGMWVFYGKGGIKTIAATAVIYVISLFIAHVVYVNDVVAQLQSSNPGLALADAFIPVIQAMGFMHWVCIAIGFYACWRAESRNSA